MAVSVHFGDLELLDAVRDFTLRHEHPDIARFKSAMRDWGDDWRERPPRLLPAARLLPRFAAERGCHPLISSFAAAAERLHWEQSYRREDALVPEAMLDGYAFAEILGRRGPFVSERIRAGIGVWGPNIDYPRHHHRAEEIYLVLAGSADFTLGDNAPRSCSRDQVVFVASDTRHGFATRDEPLAVFYLWQAGDLRQQSSFE